MSVYRTSLWHRLSNVGLAVLTILACLFILMPFLWMVSTSFKHQGQVFSNPLSLIPYPWNFANYFNVWQTVPMVRYLVNSFIVASSTTLGVLTTAILAGYSLSRLHFKGRDTLFFLTMGTMMIPLQVTMIPSFILIHWFGWIDSYQGLIVPFLVSPFGIFLCRQFFLGIPRDLEDASLIDGCGRLGVIRHVIIPNSGPALSALSLFTFTLSWNNFFWPLIITTTRNMRVIQLGLANMKGEYTIQWPLLMAATVLATLPIFLLYVGLQRYFVRGIVTTGLKG